MLEIADAALAMGAAADLAVRGRHASVELQPGRFWYATTWAPVLWWHRLRGHAGRRSVFFQNAVRIALALTAARLVAGVDTLPHGFWAMLATLTLTRTTMGETWSTIRLALAGTLAGALLSAGVLICVGSDTTVYAVLLPLWMLLGFTVGPVRGVGWAQGLFTVLVALVFAQLAPPTWRLAEVRVLNVLVGSAIGAVFGVLALAGVAMRSCAGRRRTCCAGQRRSSWPPVPRWRAARCRPRCPGRPITAVCNVPSSSRSPRTRRCRVSRHRPSAAAGAGCGHPPWTGRRR
ncbi:FUSC family protein [Streptomyces canarius]